MKLQLPQPVAPQSLGRYDINAPVRLASAEVQAQQAWGDAFKKAANAAVEIYAMQKANDGTLTLAERQAMDSMSNAKLISELENSPYIDVDDKNAPEIVRKFAKQNKLKGELRTADYIDDIMQLQFSESSAATYEALNEFNNNEELKAKYVDSMRSSWTSQAGKSVQIAAIQRNQEEKVRVDSLIDGLVSDGNVSDAHAAILEAERRGVFTPVEAGERYDAVEPAVDKRATELMLRDATDYGDLDDIENFVLDSNIPDEDQPTYFKKIDQLKTEFQRQESRKQAEVYQDGMNMLVNGQLTAGWISAKLSTRELTAANANVLRNALSEPPPLQSSPAAVNALETEIAMLELSDPFEEGFSSVDEREARIKAMIRAKLTGVSLDGRAVEKSLTGQDAIELSNKLNAQVNRVYGKGTEPYGIAITRIDDITGYSDKMSEIIAPSAPERLANSDFRVALSAYMRSTTNPDPMKFVSENRFRYTPSVYAIEEPVKRLAKMFPQLSIMLDEVIVPAAIINTAYEMMVNQDLDRADFEIIIDTLQNADLTEAYSIPTDYSQGQGQSGTTGGGFGGGQ